METNDIMGKYLHLFRSENNFQTAYNGSAYHEPWTSLTDIATPHVNYNKKPIYSVDITTVQGDTDHSPMLYYQTTDGTVTIQLQDVIDWIEEGEGAYVPTLEDTSAYYIAFGPAYQEGETWMGNPSKYNPSTAFYDEDTFYDDNTGIDRKTHTGTVTVNLGQGWINAMKNASSGTERTKLSSIQAYLHPILLESGD